MPAILTRAGNRVQSCTRKGGPQTLSPITFVLLRAASGPLDELQAAASGMPVGKLEVFLNAADIGDILAHAWQWGLGRSCYRNHRGRSLSGQWARRVYGGATEHRLPIRGRGTRSDRRR